MRRPGFTILELVIALGVIALLGGLAAPALYSRLGDSRLEAAARDVAAVVAAVRADAVREGRALELRAERDGAGVRLVSAPLEEGPIAGEDGAAPEPVRTLRFELPAGVDVSDSLPDGVEASPPLAPAEVAAPRDVVIGVLMPDGSAWSSTVTYLALAHEPTRALEVKLNSWTGVALVTEVPNALPGDGAEGPR